MPTYLVVLLYLACLAGAVVLAPGPVSLPLLAFTFLVWLGGVTAAVLWQRVGSVSP